MRKSIILALLLLIAAPGSLYALGQARITGKVVDSEGNPLKANITVEAIEVKTFKEVFESKDDGTYTIAVVDGTIRYSFTVEAEGYAPYSTVIKMTIVPGKNERVFTLNKGSGGGAASVEFNQVGDDPASLLYNEAAQLANDDKLDEAIAKLVEAVALKDDLVAGWSVLAKLYMRKEDYPKAIEAAEKVIGMMFEDDEMHSILAFAYDKVGNAEKAAEYANKMPDNAGVLYNEAVEHLNAGEDAKAEPLLRRAIKADASFAQAYYQLGMVYVRTQKNDLAKSNLQKFLELNPTGDDAAMATEMIKYLN